MPRERFVTRTITLTRVEVMCMDVEKAEVVNKIYELSGSYDDEESLKKLKKLYETDTFKLVHVNEQNSKELLYGMPEDEFMKLARVLPPRQVNK